MKILLLSFIIFFCFVNCEKIQSQSDISLLYNCTFDQGGMQTSFIGGNLKPERTDIYPGTDENTIFPVIVVFVKFPSGEPYPNDPNWPANGDPVYLNNVIAPTRNNNYGNNWWDAYVENDYRLSDFWMEASRGHFHVIGQAFSLTLPLTAEQYRTQYGTASENKINDDIYYLLQQRITPQDWYKYDKWSRDYNGNLHFEPDNYIDMIYKIHRSWAGGIGMPAGGIAQLYNSYQYGADYPVPNTTLMIRGPWYSGSIVGSGVTITPGTYDGSTPRLPINLKGIVSFTAHEHGHYTYGDGHASYGKMSGAGAGFGVDEFLSPWKSIKLGYMTPRLIDYNNPPAGNLYSIDDYSSRDNYTEGQVLKAPVASSEYFLIANRMKESSYDIVMWGDTCREDPYFDLGQQYDYGKGLYIYHSISGENWPPVMDQECADGLWDYEQSDYQYPDWSTSQQIPYFIKTQPVFFKNDFSDCDDAGNPGTRGLSWRDGKSVNKYFNPFCVNSYFGVGKRETPPGSSTPGTDRIFTNVDEVWTSREYLGDRWDAWRINYNEVFSPYSSPSTVNWSSQYTGIFIYLESSNGNTANLKIYRTDNGGYNEAQILELTPPSRPMGLELGYSACENGVSNPILTWHHNLEPDMIIPSVFGDYKIYKIYRTSTGNLAELPNENNYQLIATVNIPVNDVPTYRDNNTQLECDPFGEPDINYAVRYRVTAVDGSDWESVKSDFVSDLVSKVYENHLRLPENTPKVFSLSQNYPNPFNPITVIKYTIPYSGFVSLKVYNLLGEEIAELVSERKAQGEYNVTFDGSNLASGVYFYKLEMGNYTATKKMVLIK